jgi:hypothetical protein
LKNNFGKKNIEDDFDRYREEYNEMDKALAEFERIKQMKIKEK